MHLGVRGQGQGTQAHVWGRLGGVPAPPRHVGPGTRGLGPHLPATSPAVSTCAQDLTVLTSPRGRLGFHTISRGLPVPLLRAPRLTSRALSVPAGSEEQPSAEARASSQSTCRTARIPRPSSRRSLLWSRRCCGGEGPAHSAGGPGPSDRKRQPVCKPSMDRGLQRPAHLPRTVAGATAWLRELLGPSRGAPGSLEAAVGLSLCVCTCVCRRVRGVCVCVHCTRVWCVHCMCVHTRVCEMCVVMCVMCVVWCVCDMWGCGV